jgi:hypothetical protein
MRTLSAVIGVILVVLAGCQPQRNTATNTRPFVASRSVRQPHKVKADEAMRIAREFLGTSPIGPGKDEGVKLWRQFRPYVPCHFIEFEHKIDRAGATDPNQGNTDEPPMKAYMQVEESTGRVIRYQSDVGYWLARNNGKPKPNDDRLMPMPKAQAVAEGYIQRAGISMDGLRVVNITHVDMHRKNGDREYAFSLVRFANLEGIGEVMLPESLGVVMDAVTGELKMFLCTDHPLEVEFTKPVIPVQQAERTAIEACKPECPESAQTSLTIYTGRFTKCKHALAWYTAFYEKDRPESIAQDAFVDAKTGKVLWAAYGSAE